MGNHITDKERMVLSEFNNDDHKFSNWDGGFKVDDSGTYHTTFSEEVATLLGSTVQGARGVISSMIKKGWLKSTTTDHDETGKPDHWLELTDAGVEMISDLAIEDDESALMLDEDDEPVHPDSEEYQERLTAQRAAAKADAQDKGKPGLRTSHANCTHATHGKEGKIARAKCRRERAAAAKALETKATVDA